MAAPRAAAASRTVIGDADILVFSSFDTVRARVAAAIWTPASIEIGDNVVVGEEVSGSVNVVKQ